MIRLRTAISLIAVLALTATAGATPITFSLENGTFASGATISGTVVIDTATGSMVSADLTYMLGGSIVTFDRPFFAQVALPPLYGVYFPLMVGGIVDGPQDPHANPPAVDEFDFILPLPSLVAYTGGSICTYSSYYCGGGVFSEYYGRVNFIGNDGMATGNLVPLTAATPEPSGFALTITGLALCTFMWFRGFRRTHTETPMAAAHSFG